MNSTRFPLSNVYELALALLMIFALNAGADAPLIGPPGLQATYHLTTPLRSNSVERLTLNLGPIESSNPRSQWLSLHGSKANGRQFTVWVLGRSYPPRTLNEARESIVRYVLQEADSAPQEYVHRFTGAPVLPSLGGWSYTWPHPAQGEWRDGIVPSQVDWLGHRYTLESTNQNAPFITPSQIRKLELLPDVLIGVPSNKRTKDDTRRFDGSDYEMVRLTRDNYTEMIRAGLNCFSVDAEQADWLKDEPAFCWGIGGADIAFPECLFRSTYLGPALFLDEPAVGTRDYDIRPRLAKDAAFRRTLTPQVVLDEFKKHYHRAVAEGAPTAFIKGIQSRQDVDLGTMSFAQQNLYSWETMVASAAWELTGEGSSGPQAIVFEPPGRIGSRRTLPEMNMSYGCQLPPENPANFSSIIFGFLRGAARAADKNWGVSIYGAVDRADAPWLLTHAYDLGATHFFFWDNYQLACVPYSEYLGLARHLQAHVQSHPGRNLARLKQAAEVAILLPAGYDLGHTHTGRGNLWGLGELNLERTNRFGVSYRRVMGNFFTEIERCARLGVAFDLLWDLDALKLDGYREVVHVREDGRVEIFAGGKHTTHKGPRTPERPPGNPPKLTLELANQRGENPRSFAAKAQISETSAPVYYTSGADRQGVYHNVMMLWELFGPGPEDYRQLSGRVISPLDTNRTAVVETKFALEQPGSYRLRAATTDSAGRSTVVWKEFKVER